MQECKAEREVLVQGLFFNANAKQGCKWLRLSSIVGPVSCFALGFIPACWAVLLWGDGELRKEKPGAAHGGCCALGSLLQLCLVPPHCISVQSLPRLPLFLFLLVCLPGSYLALRFCVGAKHHFAGMQSAPSAQQPCPNGAEMCWAPCAAMHNARLSAASLTALLSPDFRVAKCHVCTRRAWMSLILGCVDVMWEQWHTTTSRPGKEHLASLPDPSPAPPQHSLCLKHSHTEFFQWSNYKLHYNCSLVLFCSISLTSCQMKYKAGN